MTRDQFADILSRLGYSPAQAAEAAGCSADTIRRAAAGDTPVPLPVATSLHRHELLVRAGLEERVPERKRGRRPKAA